MILILMPSGINTVIDKNKKSCLFEAALATFE
jgi:hypothetical protein